MEPRSRFAFVLLVLVQAMHSVEEYVFRLYDVFAPARAVADSIGIERSAGFAVANTVLVLFGLYCCYGPARRGGAWGLGLAWGWALVEIANGFGHIALAAAAGGYFPGLATAPLLIAAGLWLIGNLTRRSTA